MSNGIDATKILHIHEPSIGSNMLKYPQLFEGTDLHSMCTSILKEQGVEAQPTNQTKTTTFGLNSLGVPRPVDICAARRMKDISPHHSSCIQSKKYAAMGLGFVSDASDVEDSKKKPKTPNVAETEEKVMSLLTGEAFIESKVDTVLDKLTVWGFMPELFRAVEDMLDGGTGYLEIVRNSGFITGINWLPYEDIEAVEVIDREFKTRVIYRYVNSGSGFSTSQKYYSIFGLANRRWVYDTYYKNSNVPVEAVSEVIPFMTPSNRSKRYGYPEWLAASSVITLLAMSMQHKSDFYTNKGVLAYILAISGQVDSDKWTELENMIQSSVGGGNNFKNFAINVPTDSKVQVEKMASSDKTELQFAKDNEVFAQSIVSAHRVPPVLANILIPGKLGATNEAVQALVSFQLLVVGPIQNIIQKTLARTLGGAEGIQELDPEDFRLRTVTSQFDIAGLDTIGKAREEAVTADRDFSDGVKD